MKKRYNGFAAFFVLLSVLFGFNMNMASAEEVLKIKLGTAINLDVQDAVYQSSDETIAYVNKNGRVTGKKTGTAVITVKKGNTVVKKNVTVIANGKKTDINVCVDEIVLKKNTLSSEVSKDIDVSTDSAIDIKAEPTYKLTVELKNKSKKDAKRVILEGRVLGQKVQLDFGSIKAGKTDKKILKGLTGEKMYSFQPKRLYVYSKDMLSVYHYETSKLTYEYGTKDTIAPVISGFIGDNSHNDGIPYQIVYKGEKHDYLAFVKAEDERDGKVTITADTSKINFDKKGTYTVIYTAKDASGNVAKAEAKVGVRLANEKVDTYASIILEDITKDSWSDEKKAIAIYNYVRRNMSYTGSSDKSSWEKEAVNGFLNGRGDCFTYYGMARILLTRAGIPNIEVRRVQGHGNHWWNMVYVNNEFYHFDTVPRKAGGRFCLVTDDQLKDYSKKYGNSHIWAYDKKPKSSTKVISSIW